MKNFLIAVLAFFVLAPVQAASTNKTTGTLARASERVSLNSLYIAALARSEHRYATYCQEALSNPVIPFDYTHPQAWPTGGAPIVVSMRGETAMPELNQRMQERAGMILTCVEFLAQLSPGFSEALRKQRPNREQAINGLKKQIDFIIDISAEWFESTYEIGKKMAVYVDAGNNGFASSYLLVPGISENARPDSPNHYSRSSKMVVEAEGWKGMMYDYDQRINMKENIFHAVNNVPAREVIYNGIFAYRTLPTVVKTQCMDPPANECGGRYVVAYDGSNVTVTKNGSVWFDKTSIGGAEYAIELSGEVGSSSNTQVQKKGGW